MEDADSIAELPTSVDFFFDEIAHHENPSTILAELGFDDVPGKDISEYAEHYNVFKDEFLRHKTAVISYINSDQWTGAVSDRDKAQLSDFLGRYKKVHEEIPGEHLFEKQTPRIDEHYAVQNGTQVVQQANFIGDTPFRWVRALKKIGVLVDGKYLENWCQKENIHTATKFRGNVQRFLQDAQTHNKYQFDFGASRSTKSTLGVDRNNQQLFAVKPGHSKNKWMQYFGSALPLDGFKKDFDLGALSLTYLLVCSTSERRRANGERFGIPDLQRLRRGFEGGFETTGALYASHEPLIKKFMEQLIRKEHKFKASHYNVSKSFTQLWTQASRIAQKFSYKVDLDTIKKVHDEIRSFVKSHRPAKGVQFAPEPKKQNPVGVDVKNADQFITTWRNLPNDNSRPRKRKYMMLNFWIKCFPDNVVSQFEQLANDPQRRDRITPNIFHQNIYQYYRFVNEYVLMALNIRDRSDVKVENASPIQNFMRSLNLCSNAEIKKVFGSKALRVLTKKTKVEGLLKLFGDKHVLSFGGKADTPPPIGKKRPRRELVSPQQPARKRMQLSTPPKTPPKRARSKSPRRSPILNPRFIGSSPSRSLRASPLQRLGSVPMVEAPVRQIKREREQSLLKSVLRGDRVGGLQIDPMVDNSLAAAVDFQPSVFSVASIEPVGHFQLDDPIKFEDPPELMDTINALMIGVPDEKVPELEVATPERAVSRRRFDTLARNRMAIWDTHLDTPSTEDYLGGPLDIGSPGLLNFDVASSVGSALTGYTNLAVYNAPIDRSFVISLKELHERMGKKTQLYSTRQKYGFDLKEIEEHHKRIDPIGFHKGKVQRAGRHIKSVTNFADKSIVFSHNAKATRKNIEAHIRYLQGVLPAYFKVYFKIRKQWVLMSAIRTIDDLEGKILSRKRGVLHVKIQW